MSLMFANHYQYLYIEDIVQNQTYQQKIWYFVGSQTSEYVYVNLWSWCRPIEVNFKEYAC